MLMIYFNEDYKIYVMFQTFGHNIDYIYPLVHPDQHNNMIWCILLILCRNDLYRLQRYIWTALAHAWQNKMNFCQSPRKKLSLYSLENNKAMFQCFLVSGNDKIIIMLCNSNIDDYETFRSIKKKQMLVQNTQRKSRLRHTGWCLMAYLQTINNSWLMKRVEIRKKVHSC